MSKHLTLFKTVFMAILLVTIPIGLTACGQTPQGKIASTPLTVLSISGGEVLIMKPGGNEWIRADSGITLEVDYKIKTVVNGQATITFFEGSIIELNGNTEIELAELDMAGTANTIQLKQTIGSTMSRVKKLADPASRYEIETPAVVAAVRGTTMYVSVSTNGTTVVGNVEGSAVAIVKGIETPISVGKHVNVEPGKDPGIEEPGAIAEPTTAVVPTSQQTTPASQQPTPTSTPEPTIKPVASISITSALNQQTVFNGDTITIAFTVANTSTVPISDITVTDEKAGPATYSSGDGNNNKILDPGESWISKVDFTVPANVSNVLTTSATVTGKDPDQKSVNNSVSTQITITPLTVMITPPNEKVVNAIFSLAGTVNDPSITEVTIDVNGKVSSVKVVKGIFSTPVTLNGSTNVIIVTATKTGGTSAKTSIKFTQAN